MRLCRVLGVCLLLWGCSGRNAEQKEVWNWQNPKLQQLVRLQDARDGQALAGWLGDPDARIRARAAFALGSVQAAETLTDLLPLLEDEAAEVRQAAAFAIGQLGQVQAEPQLIYALQGETEPTVREYLAEALGKCCSKQGLSFLLTLEQADARWGWAQMLGIYQAAMRGVRLEAAQKWVWAMLAAAPEARMAELGMSYLRRLRVSPTAAQMSMLSTLLGHEDWRVRLQASYLMAQAQDQLRARLAAETIPQVRIALLQLLNEADAQALALARAWLGLDIPNLQTAAADFLGRHAPTDQLKSLTKAIPADQPDALAALLEGVAQRQPSAVDWTDYLPSESDYFALKPLAIMAMRHDVRLFERQLGRFAALDSVAQEVYTEALLSAAPTQPEADTVGLWKVLEGSLLSRSVARKYHAGQYLLKQRNPAYEATLLRDSILEKAFATLQLPRDVEVYWQLQQLEAMLAGHSFTPELPKGQQTFNPSLLADYAENPRVALQLDHGQIVLELYPMDAPGTVLTFLGLVERGFYDGKVFHRVIPNFVVQGGGPLGNGFGSLDEPIRSEFSLKRFVTGSVGIASAGKDTESCQFFITHLPTHHLNGKYTLFAQVIEGMDLVQRIGPGEKIHQMRLLD